MPGGAIEGSRPGPHERQRQSMHAALLHAAHSRSDGSAGCPGYNLYSVECLSVGAYFSELDFPGVKDEFFRCPEELNDPERESGPRLAH